MGARAKAKEETREALVDAAQTLFAKRGFDAPSLDEICERAGYTRGAFYVHFADRDALVTAVMQRVGRRFLDALMGAEDDDLAMIATRFVAAMAAGEYPLTRKGGIRPYQLLEACARSRAIRAEYVGLVDDTMKRLATATRRTQNERRMRKDLSPDAVAFLLVSAVIGVHTLMDLEVEVDLSGSARFLMELLA